MKKLGIGLATLAFAFVAFAPAASAQNSTIQQLMETIKTLQAQLETLKAARQQVTTATSNVKSTVNILRNLREGMSGDDVKELQQLLASDPSIYPEGLVSGYYGSLTTKAVRAFQKKHGIDQAGEVGPRTRAFLGELAKKGIVVRTDTWNSTSTGTGTTTGGTTGGQTLVTICHMPPGNSENAHTITVGAPAVLAHLKHGDKLGSCGGTGGGGNGSTTVDILAPIISGLSVASTTSSSASVVWTTNENASSQVWYSTTTPVLTTNNSAATPGFVTAHSVPLIGLTSSTTYYVLVSTADIAGNTATSSTSFFTP